MPVNFGDDVDAALAAARALAPVHRATVTPRSALERATPETSRFLPATSAIVRA